MVNIYSHDDDEQSIVAYFRVSASALRHGLNFYYDTNLLVATV